MDFNLATPFKRGLLEILENYFLGHTNARVRVFDRVAKWRNFSCHFAKKWFHHTLSGQFLKLSQNHGKRLQCAVSFQYSCRWVIGQLELLKSIATKRFSLEFSKTFKTSLKNVWSDFLQALSFKKYNNPVTSIKWRHIPFPGKLSTISEYSKETFSLESVFTEVGNNGLQVCSVIEKGKFL